MRTVALVVAKKTFAKVSGESDVGLVRVVDTAKNVNVIKSPCFALRATQGMLRGFGVHGMSLFGDDRACHAKPPEGGAKAL